MGFSFHETTIFPGGRTHIHYKNHLEAVWCVEGDGSIQTIADGKTYALEPGVVYALNEHDEHWLCGGKEPLRVICVFNPPLTGQEVHDKDGVMRCRGGADAVAVEQGGEHDFSKIRTPRADRSAIISARIRWSTATAFTPMPWMPRNWNGTNATASCCWKICCRPARSAPWRPRSSA